MKSPVQYQGFWIRFCANIIDTAIGALFGWVLGLALNLFDLSVWGVLGIAILVGILFSMVYETIMVARYGGTIGKLLLRMKVISDTEMTYKTAFIRHISKYVSSITLGIGYLMVAWDEKKQGLHDKMAQTYVVEDTSSRITPTWRIISIVGAILAIVLYIAYITSIIVWSASSAIEASRNPLDPADPEADLQARCSSIFPQRHDICLTAYAEDPGLVKRTPEQREQHCVQMRTNDLRVSCYADLASARYDIAVCDALSGRHQKACQQQFEAVQSVRSSFEDAPREITGDLSDGKATLSVQIDQECIPVRGNTVQNGQEVCITVTASGFQAGADGMHQYAIDSTLRREDGILMFTQRDIQENGRERLTNNKLEYTFTLTTNTIPPGTYRNELTVYDAIGKKAYLANQTIVIQTEQVEDQTQTLTVYKAFAGIAKDGTCEPREGHFFDDEIACFVVDAGNFSKDANGINHFDIDVRTYNESGDLIDNSQSVYEDDGRVVLRNGKLGDNHHIVSTLADFDLGKNVQELKVYDALDRRQVVVRFNFTLLKRPEPRETLNMVKLKIGVPGDTCEGDWDSFEYKAGSVDTLCFEPYVGGMVDDGTESVVFDMNIKIVDANGETIVDDKNIWEGEGTGYLENGYLFDYWIRTPVSKLSAGTYSATVVVYDKIGNTKGTITREFIVT